MGREVLVEAGRGAESSESWGLNNLNRLDINKNLRSRLFLRKIGGAEWVASRNRGK